MYDLISIIHGNFFLLLVDVLVNWVQYFLSCHRGQWLINDRQIWKAVGKAKHLISVANIHASPQHIAIKNSWISGFFPFRSHLFHCFGIGASAWPFRSTLFQNQNVICKACNHTPKGLLRAFENSFVTLFSPPLLSTLSFPWLGVTFNYWSQHYPPSSQFG